MTPSWLVLIGVLTPLMGIFGSLAFPYIQRRLGWSNLRIVIFLALAVSCIPAYGCLGFIPFVKHNLPFGGLTTPGEMFGLAIYFGTYVRGVMSILYPYSGQALRMARFRAMHGHAMRNLYRKAKKRDGMRCSPSRTR